MGSVRGLRRILSQGRRQVLKEEFPILKNAIHRLKEQTYGDEELATIVGLLREALEEFECGTIRFRYQEKEKVLKEEMPKVKKRPWID